MLPALILIATATATPTSATDICLAMIPPRLAAVLQREHADYVAPTLTDAPVERLMAATESGDWPCPFAAIADFDGDGHLDRALVLKHKSDRAVRFVIARNDDGNWRIELQRDWTLRIEEAKVEPLEAGFYEQTKGGRDATRQIDNLKSIQSDHAGFRAGAAEAASQGFFFVNGVWQDLWLAD